MPVLKNIGLCYLFCEALMEVARAGKVACRFGEMLAVQCGQTSHCCAVDSAKQVCQSGMFCEAAADVHMVSNSI